MPEYNYTVLLTPAEEGGFTVTCPALPGLVTEGDTYEDAMERAKDAIQCHIESMLMDGEALPADVDPCKAIVHGQIPQAAA